MDTVKDSIDLVLKGENLHYSLAPYSLENQPLIYSASVGTNALTFLPEVLIQRSYASFAPQVILATIPYNFIYNFICG